MQHKRRIKRREFLGKSVIAVAGISCFRPWSIDGFPLDRLIPVPNGRGHTMLIVGTKTPFLCHQPEFSEKRYLSPHRYQVILEANFGAVQKNYEQARARDQGQSWRSLYTFDPQNFALSELNRRTAPRTQLTGSIFRSRLGKDEPIEYVVEDVRATVRKIYFQEFTSTLKKPTNLQYVMFGNLPEIFMAHVITRPPDFDHVVSLKAVDSSSFPADSFSKELRRGLKVTLNQGNSIALRPSPKQGLLVAEAEISISRKTVPIRFEVESELYLEEGELRSPSEYATTPAEKEAGFP